MFKMWVTKRCQQEEWVIYTFYSENKQSSGER